MRATGRTVGVEAWAAERDREAPLRVGSRTASRARADTAGASSTAKKATSKAKSTAKKSTARAKSTAMKPPEARRIAAVR
jgi:hypothetical protein